MKKFLLSVFPCTLAFTPVALPTVAFADPGRDIVEFCKAVNDAFPGFYESTGDCVSEGAQICVEIRKADQLEFYGFKTMGECVNSLKSNF